MTPRVACIGDNCLDVYSGALEAEAIGGNALNVAVGLRTSLPWVAYLGAVGEDSCGRRVLEALRDLDVDVSRVREAPGSTAVTYLHVTDDGERHIVREEYGVCRTYFPSEDDLTAVADCAIVHACNVATERGVESIGRLVSAAARNGIRLSYDLGLYADALRLDGLDIAFSSHEAGDAQSAPQRARDLAALGARIAVVTCGADGSVAFDGRHVFRVPAMPVDVVDTTGAGDSYIAAFLTTYLRGADIPECMEAGSLAGAETCRLAGAWPGSLQAAISLDRGAASTEAGGKTERNEAHV